MSCRNTIRVVAAATAFTIAPSVLAVPITGSFTGLADGWRILEFAGPQVPFANEPVSGEFSFETAFSGADVYRDTSSVAYFGWPVRFTAELFGFERLFEGVEQGFTHALILSEADRSQSAELYFFAAYANASVRFVAPEGGLFSNFDPMTFNPAAVSVAASTAHFSANTRGEGINVRFTDIRFDGKPPHGVPEPASLGLLALGLLGFSVLRRARCDDARMR